MPSRLRVFFLLFLLSLAVFILIGYIGTRYYVDYLWFQSLNYQNVFIKILITEYGLRLAIGFLFFAFIFINLLFTRPHVLKAAKSTSIFKDDNIFTIQASPWSSLLTSRLLTVAYLILSLAIAALFSTSVAGDWVTIQKFLHPTTFNLTDPLFNYDLSFYIFQLPFYQLLYNIANLAVLTTAFWILVIYMLVSATQGNPGNILQNISARYHFSFLAALFFIIRAAGYRLEQFGLLFTHHGTVWGPGYAAVHATLIAYKILSYIALVCALAILINLVLRRFKYIVYSIGFLIAASILLGGAYPSFVQKFRVTPNEYVMEKPYLENNIRYTRMAYDLNRIEKQDFPAGRTLTPSDIRNNPETVSNIRLWDWEPLQQTYSQLQEIRTYYQFTDIDVDRYVIDGRYRQVMLAARELNQERLPPQAKTWINTRLKYTHGYGIAMSPVNEITGEGLPAFFLKDIPPVSFADLQVTRPEIYYGELTDQYVIVNTKSQEFDYPSGDENVYTTYQDKSGVRIDNYLRRTALATVLGDYKLLLSGEITNDSQALFHRNIYQRVPKIAPFLRYDNDPYIVLNDDGALYWLWDAYTFTGRYPYSEPFDRNNNYIRNSVKVVINAYNGQVNFYMADNNDPLIQTYSKIFPSLFKSFDEMPENLKNHVRYPVDYFKIQASMYTSYHMEDPLVFYNKEDKWNLPTELYAGAERAMEPYYTIIKLPGEQVPEFVLILPFTPQNRKNMIAWLSARADGDNYGRLLAYNFPKQELVYGPMQVEARINQDTTIQQQVALWDQRGSRVIRGNLLAIPIKDALLYVEPLFLQADQSRMPELRRIIVVHGDRVVMEPTLTRALERIFGDEALLQKTDPIISDDSTPASSEPGISAMIKRANAVFEEAQNKLKAGDWSGYGESLGLLKQILTELEDKTAN